jgi:sulfate/thiosulfate transport system permease protein
VRCFGVTFGWEPEGHPVEHRTAVRSPTSGAWAPRADVGVRPTWLHSNKKIKMKASFKSPGILPGFWPSLSYTVLYLSVIVLIPLCGVFLKAASSSWDHLWRTVTAPNVVAAYELSFGASVLAGFISVVIGLLIAWVLVRYNFPGKTLADALVDLPFALPTAVAGISLTSLYAANGWIGQYLEPLGVKVAFTRLGVVVALTFIGLPFVVRSVQPVLAEADAELEEAARSLGASRWQVFSRVVFPLLRPALITGFALAFARGLGEYGSVIFISGNLPMRTEIAPLLIVNKLEQYDYAGATAIAVVMLVASFLILLGINRFERHTRKFMGAE